MWENSRLIFLDFRQGMPGITPVVFTSLTTRGSRWNVCAASF